MILQYYRQTQNETLPSARTESGYLLGGNTITVRKDIKDIVPQHRSPETSKFVPAQLCSPL